ncbi:hypothetical protein BD779DRAFT_1473218 [Infundibulicybe gibba]|nr:hypothetical protein BD779DRAFT_1473218 [Infundibulicybe gibba]
MADLFPADENVRSQTRPTPAEKAALTRAWNKQQEQRELDALMATTSGKRLPLVSGNTHTYYMAQSGGRSAKKAALDSRAWEALIPGKSTKRPPSTPNKASEKVKVPRMVRAKTSPVAGAKQAKASGKPHSKHTNKAKATPPTRGIGMASATPKRPLKARANPSHKVKSTAIARQHLPPSMDESEDEDESDGDSAAADPNLNTSDGAMDVDVSDDGARESSDPGDEAGDGTGTSHKLDEEPEEPEDADSTEESEGIPAETATWGHGGSSEEEEGGLGDTTFRQLPRPESPTLSRASSVLSFTNQVMDLSILDPDSLQLDDGEQVPSVYQPTKRSSAAKSSAPPTAPPRPTVPSVAPATHHTSSHNKNKAAPPPALAQGAISGGHHLSRKTRPASSPPLDRGITSSQARSVSSNPESLIQRTQSVRTTVNSKSSSIEVVDEISNELGKKKTKRASVKIAPGQPHLTAELARKGVSKRKENAAKEVRALAKNSAHVLTGEVAGWTDIMPTEEAPAEGIPTSRNTIKSKATIKTVSTSTKLKKEEITRRASAPTATVWPDSTTFFNGGLTSQSPHIKQLIRLNIDDIVGELVFKNAYPDKLEINDLATKSLLARAKELRLVDVRRCLKAERAYLVLFLDLVTTPPISRSTQRIHNTRTKIREACSAQCATHYQVKLGDYEQAGALIEDSKFIFPGDPFGDLDTKKPFQHPGIIAALEIAFFCGLSEKHQDRLPTTTVKGKVRVMIPKVMVILVVTTLHAAILHAADKSRGFHPDQMMLVYQDLMALMDQFEDKQPGQYKAAMIKIYESASGTAAKDSKGPGANGAWKLFNFEDMDTIEDLEDSEDMPDTVEDLEGSGD